MITEKIVASKTHGTRIITGTDWPIVDIVYRRQRPLGKPYWILTRAICNGIAHGGSTHYKTQREALEALNN